MNDSEMARLDRSALRASSLDDETQEWERERGYWRAKTPEERMLVMEMLGQLNYGYDPATARLQRIFEVAELE